MKISFCDQIQRPPSHFTTKRWI